MAAETAVEITAQETALTEDRQAKAEHSEATVQEGRLERAEIVLEERSETTLKEEASAVTVQEEALEKTQREEALEEIVQEEASVKIQREEASAATVQEDHSERTLKEDHSEKIVQEEALVRTPKEEALAEGSQLPAAEVDSTLQRRASTRRISTISVTRTKAASTR